MSENNPNNVAATDAASELSEEFILRVNAAKNEVQLINPKTGKTTSLKAEIVQEDEETTLEWQQPKNLTVEQFADAWKRLQKLGITWSTDIPPAPVFVHGPKRDEEFWDQFRGIQKEFPKFPYELGSTVLHALLSPAGNKEIDQKAILIADLLSKDYRAEFFFKYAVKVSYFEDIDWEVVVKAYEKGTPNMPKIAYALLSLVLRNPLNTTLPLEEAANEHRDPEFITVAVNETLIDQLIARLFEAKTALEKAQRATNSLTEVQWKEKDNEPSSS